MPPWPGSDRGLCVLHDRQSDEQVRLKALERQLAGSGPNPKYSLVGYQLPATLDWRRVLPDRRTEGEIDLTEAHFAGVADFREFAFLGDARFAHATFESDAWLSNARFARNVDFMGVTFRRAAAFDGLHVGGDAYFRRARFEGPASFAGSQFLGAVSLSSCEFEASAVFEEAAFARAIDAGETRFRGAASLDRARFAESLHLQNARFDDQHAAESSFRAARLVCEASGERASADSYHRSEMVARRRQKRGPFGRIEQVFEYVLVDLLAAYGLSWSRVAAFALLVVVAAGAIAAFGGDLILAPNNVHIVSLPWPSRVLYGLYFSIVTFTTVGYSNVQPSGLVTSALAAAESLVGTLFIAILVALFLRRFLR
jgi:hypothetical protein